MNRYFGSYAMDKPSDLRCRETDFTKTSSFNVEYDLWAFTQFLNFIIASQPTRCKKDFSHNLLSYSLPTPLQSTPPLDDFIKMLLDKPTDAVAAATLALHKTKTQNMIFYTKLRRCN